MSWREGLDTSPRMREYMRPEDLNDEGCILLAQTILSEARQKLLSAIIADRRERSKKSAAARRDAEYFFTTPFYEALALGAVDGRATIEHIEREADEAMNRKEAPCSDKRAYKSPILGS